MEQQAVHLISSQAQSTTLAIFLHSSMKKNEYVAHKGFEPLILRMRISRPGPTRRMRRLISGCKITTIIDTDKINRGFFLFIFS